jgi:hypothetical protein
MKEELLPGRDLSAHYTYVSIGLRKLMCPSDTTNINASGDSDKL